MTQAMNPRARDARLNAYLRAVAPEGRDAVRCGPFLATFDRKRENPFRNYAIPDDDADPTPDDIAAFVALCREHDRRPRLEYAPEACPRLEPALLAAGFEVEFRPPFLTCTPETLAAAPAPEGFSIRPARGGDLDLCAAVLNDAYAEHGFDSDGDPAEMARSIAAGAECLVAVETGGDRAAACGLFTPPTEGLTEVAGIGTARAFRRRGLATALTSALTAEAFRRGVGLAFLTPGGDEAQRAYERAGFRVGGTMLMIGKPPPS